MSPKKEVALSFWVSGPPIEASGLSQPGEGLGPSRRACEGEGLEKVTPPIPSQISGLSDSDRPEINLEFAATCFLVNAPFFTCSLFRDAATLLGFHACRAVRELPAEAPPWHPGDFLTTSPLDSASLWVSIKATFADGTLP